MPRIQRPVSVVSMRRPTALSCLVPLALVGCLFQNMSPGTKLREAVQDGNEAARWSRMDIAMEKVAPAYAAEYARRHYDWGEGIQLADLDIVSMQMADDEKTATVVVSFRWYEYDTMTLQRTVVRQRWNSLSAGGFVLVEEVVVDGNERLLEPPPEPEREEGDQEEEAQEELAADPPADEWIEDEGEPAETEPTLAAI